MKEKNYLTTLTVPIVIGLFAVIGPITWDWWNKRTNITVSHLQEVNLVEKKAEIPGLLLTYNNININTLTKLVFKIQNTGRLVLEETDVIVPPEIKFENSRILNASIEETWPKNLNPSLKVEENKLSITFPLLNPDEFITFNVLTDSSVNNYIVNGRFKRISEITILTINQNKNIFDNITFSLGFISFFSILFIIVSINMLFEIPKEKQIMSSITNNLLPIRVGDNTSNIKKYIESELKFLKSDRLKLLLNLLPQNDETISEKHTIKLIKEIEKQVKSNNAAGSAAVGFILGGIGLYYVINQLIF